MSLHPPQVETDLEPADTPYVDTAAKRLRAKDVAIAVALAIFALTMLKDVRVPVLAYVDFGFHELGHLLTYVLPDLITAMAGSFTQVAVPFGLAVYFVLFQTDLAAGGFCLGWAGTSAFDAARYIADAPYEQLELIGGDHDWAFALTELNQVQNAGTYASLVRVLAWVMLAGGVALLAHRYAWDWLRES
jgi:hypothetical protein